MQQPQAAQALGPGTGAGQFGNEDAARLADNDHFHPAAPVDEQAQLAANGPGKQSQLARLLDAVDLFLREAAVQQTIQRAGLAGLQALQISFDSGDD
ncbi:hypothetical protein [uncultured Desulfovibrio sp.]|uniref:hypothetical protein n=1 Tax=uncultured Desulfovibrio sp. TaxID=167968 RepID=UPI0026256CBF|nr:hypothetical protein [uncultured Desulfovibrio sp.]